jgi:hypothetical protein
MRFGYVFLYQVCVKPREGGLLYLPFKFAERWITKCIFATFFCTGFVENAERWITKILHFRGGTCALKCALTNIGARIYCS